MCVDAQRALCSESSGDPLISAVHLIYALKLADVMVTDGEVFLSRRNYTNYKRQTPRFLSERFISFKLGFHSNTKIHIMMKPSFNVALAYFQMGSWFVQACKLIYTIRYFL